MAEEHFEEAFRAFHGFGQVAMLRERGQALIFHADEGDACIAALQDGVVIVQQLPSHCCLSFFQVGHIGQPFLFTVPFHVSAVIVVAQHGINTIGRM